MGKGKTFGAFLCPSTHTVKRKFPWGTKYYEAMITDGGPFHGRLLKRKFNGRTKAIRYRQEVLKRWENQNREKSAVDRIAPEVKVSTASQRISQETPSN